MRRETQECGRPARGRAAPFALGGLALLAACSRAPRTRDAVTPRPVDPIEGVEVFRGDRLRAGAGEGLGTGPVESTPFDALVLSWNARLPESGRGRFEVRVRVGDRWSRWLAMGESEGRRLHSVKEPADALARLDVDTLLVTDPRGADAFEARAVLPRGADLRSLGVAAWRRGARPAAVDRVRSAAWGRTLEVPARSQGSEDPAIAARICSPTSTAMALAFLGAPIPTKDFAALAYDPGSDLYGNWSINAARAGEILGECFVAHLESFPAIEREILAGRPVVLSHAWKEGELTNGPIPKTAGHLILVVGFTNAGDLVVNDPACKPGEVRRVYRRDEIFRTWQHNASGVVYLFRPGAL